MTQPIDSKLEHKVADMALAEWGTKEMQLSEREPPTGSPAQSPVFKGEQT